MNKYPKLSGVLIMGNRISSFRADYSIQKDPDTDAVIGFGHFSTRMESFRDAKNVSVYCRNRQVFFGNKNRENMREYKGDMVVRVLPWWIKLQILWCLKPYTIGLGKNHSWRFTNWGRKNAMRVVT